ncbi:glycosyltransferase, partial [archaeon]|nr:glycosyltransferase [archaeon]
IVLVDYGSDEVVSENLKDFLKNNGVSCIKVRNVKNWNRSHALNIGLKNCSTKYILCSDIDMVFEKNYISECVKEMQFNMFHVLYTDMLDSPKNFGRLDFINDYGKIRKKCKGRGAAFVNSAYKYGSSICFTLSYFFKVIRGYDEFYKLWGAEDEDVQKRLELMGLVFKDVSSKTSHIHQWHPQHEGVKNTKGFEDQVKKNEIYLRENNSIIRNPNGWGLYD